MRVDSSKLQETILSITNEMPILHGAEYARELVKAGLITNNQIHEVENIIYKTPVSEFLYPGVMELIRRILHEGSDIVIWTQGDPKTQTAKCATSGILSLPETQTGRIITFCKNDKVSELDLAFINVILHDKTTIVFADDKSRQLFRLYEHLSTMQSSPEFRQVKILYYWNLSNDRTRGLLPEGQRTFEDLSRKMNGTIHQIKNVTLLPTLSKSIYFLDMDYTLYDTKQWINSVNSRIIDLISDGNN